MPFYKKIGNFNSKTFKFSGRSETSEYDAANEMLVTVLKHLADLVELSSDVFGSVENECRKVFERTRKLAIKIERCQEKVDKLNAKTAIVPLGSLSEQQVPTLTFLSCDVEKSHPSSLFATFPRPPFVNRLRQLAYGPAPPAVIPHCNLAPEADGRSASSSTTHIYCQPLKVPSVDESCTNVDSSTDRSMTSVIKVNSNVVPIDISGKSFSRMASFRRSLIHVDFLIRRKKKKDKRRNTVAEGESKDALNKFIASQNQQADNSNSFPEQKLITASENFNKPNYQEKFNDTAERNNNTDPVKSSNYLTENEIELKLENKSIDNSQVECKYTDTTMKLPYSKRKSKSNLPISTISAAMSVAVEMRQSNGNKSDDHSSSGNWSCSSDQNSSDSDKKPSLNNDPQKHLHLKDNSKISESLSHCKERFKARSLSTNKQRILSSEKYENHDPDVSSSTSSEIDKLHGDDITSINTSTESDAFFISSDESDEYLSDIPFSHEKYGSATSLSTLSDRSLNSLLSQTGSEITSSTGTLTSVGEEKLLMPPPPPPPKTVAASILLEIKNEDVQNLQYKAYRPMNFFSKWFISV
ncbi:serine-rich adhesin for platelets-like [Uloborus diversus]|uniref:serine-rich adhesin for platelets-like n=1 Tax=Uloborus diversus TaxID=327109 RepID=UPI002409B7BF|nr:serine-rich adhesin for platelets-like [Uloborus diversus]